MNDTRLTVHSKNHRAFVVVLSQPKENLMCKYDDVRKCALQERYQIRWYFCRDYFSEILKKLAPRNTSVFSFCKYVACFVLRPVADKMVSGFYFCECRLTREICTRKLIRCENVNVCGRESQKDPQPTSSTGVVDRVRHVTNGLPVVADCNGQGDRVTTNEQHTCIYSTTLYSYVYIVCMWHKHTLDKNMNFP